MLVWAIRGLPYDELEWKTKMLSVVIKSQLTAIGFGSEQSSGQILQRGCPNSCVLESDSERRALLTKLEHFLSVLASFPLVSDGSRNYCFLSVYTN